MRKSATDFLSTLGAPARRALEREGITSLTKLSRYSEQEVLHLHGMGPSTIPKLKKALRENGLTFKKG
jgi:DNA-directed RNA polymerase alpha subunit